MSGSLADYICSLPLLRVTKSLAFASRPRHLRDLASEHSLSPSGVNDILRRLKKAGVLREKRVGNKRYLSLDLHPEELECLRNLFQISEYASLEKRARRFSKGAAEKLEWMDEAFKFYRKVKK